MDTREIAVLRKQTTQFIKDNPEAITINRPAARVSDGAGGWTTTQPSVVAPQTMRLIPQGGPMSSRNMDGEIISPGYVLLAEYNADIQKGDTFKRNNRDYEVTFVRDDRRYETWIEAVYRG